jgi:hypothetical protein
VCLSASAASCRLAADPDAARGPQGNPQCDGRRVSGGCFRTDFRRTPNGVAHLAREMLFARNYFPACAGTREQTCPSQQPRLQALLHPMSLPLSVRRAKGACLRPRATGRVWQLGCAIILVRHDRMQPNARWRSFLHIGGQIFCGDIAMNGIATPLAKTRRGQMLAS